MLRDKIKIYQLYHTVISTALTWAVVLVINRYFYLRVHFVLGIIYCLIPAALLYLFDLYKRNAICYILLVSIIPALALVFWVTKTNPVTLFNDVLDWCYTYDWSEELYVASYANLILFLTAVISSIFFYLLTIKQLTKIILGIALFAALIVLSIYKFDISKVVVAICFLYILTVFLEQYEKFYTRKAGRQERKEGILYLVPVCLLLAVLSVSLPSGPKPIQWKIFKYLYNKLSEQIEALTVNLDYWFGGGDSEFSINMTGYSEKSGKLSTSGRLVDDDKVTLKILGLKKNDAVYLIGSVSDTYTGSSWEKSKDAYLPGYDDYLLDFMELYYALARMSPEQLKENRYLEWHSLKIQYSNIKTKTFFHPGKMSAYIISSSYDKIDTQKAQITFKKAIGKGTRYQTYYYDMNLTDEAFIQFLKNADSFSYDRPAEENMSTINYLKNSIFRQSKITELFDYYYYDILKARSELIGKSFTQLPDELPDRVYSLAYEITEGYESSYEKLKAIESYLLTNYTYSNRAPRVPEGMDYVDYFLFESKSGYCTSFATAMAVLGRCINIPTRYMEGYIARFEEKDEDNMYKVKNSYAHAWTEAYIEGVGWIPFEATPPYHNVRYTVWEKYDYNKKEHEFNPSEYLDKYRQDAPQITPPAIQNAKEEKESLWETFSGVFATLLVLVLIIVVIAIYYSVLRYCYKRDFEKADYNGKMYMLFIRILRHLKKEGFVMSPDETVLMLANRIKDYFRYEGVSFYDVAEIYMRYRYAEEEVTQKDYRKVSAFQTGLANKYRSENSRLKVWLEELIFLSRRKAYKNDI